MFTCATKVLFWPSVFLVLSYDYMTHHTRIKLHQSLHRSLSDFWVACLVGKLFPSSTCSQVFCHVVCGLSIRCVQSNIVLLTQAFRKKFVIPDFHAFTSHIDDLYENSRTLSGGQVCLQVHDSPTLFSSSFSRFNGFWLKKQFYRSHEIEMGNLKTHKMKPMHLHF